MKIDYEFLQLILVLDFYYGFEGQFLENFKKWWRHSTGGIIIFALGDPLRDIYELRIPLINTWKKDRIFAIGRRFGNKW